MQTKLRSKVLSCMISACFCDFEMNHYVAMCSINEFLMTVVVLCFLCA